MRINNISPQINFKQVIPINMQGSEKHNNYPYKNANKELTNILNNKKSEFYSKGEAKQIKAFFNSILGKDNKNIALEYSDKEKFLTTGQQSKDIQELRKFEQQAQKISTPKIKSYCGETFTTDPFCLVSNLKAKAMTFRCEMIRNICKYSDPNNKNTSITMKSKEGEERFSLFEYTKKDANGEVIETKTLDLNA